MLGIKGRYSAQTSAIKSKLSRRWTRISISSRMKKKH